MRLICVFTIIVVVSAVWTGCEAKQSNPTPSSKSKVSNPAKHSSADHAKKRHKEASHDLGNQHHPKATESHKSKHEDRPKSTTKKSEPKHNHKQQEDKKKLTTRRPLQKPKDRIKTTTKKPEKEVSTSTPSLPVVVHRKQPGGNKVINNGTSGVGFIIGAPLISCPEGQRRVRNECKTIFN